MDKTNGHEASPLTADDHDVTAADMFITAYANQEPAWQDIRADPPYVERAAFNWQQPGDSGEATFVAEPGYIAIFDSWTIAADWHPLLLPIVSQSGQGDAGVEVEAGTKPVAIIHPDEHIEELASGACFDSLEEYMTYRRILALA